VGSWNMKSGGRRLPELAQERKEAKSWSMLTLRATVSRSPHSSRPAWSSRLTAGRPAGRVTSLYDFHIPTARILYGKIRNKYSLKRNCTACFWVRFIHSQDRSAYSAAGK
jgi:transposase